MYAPLKSSSIDFAPLAEQMHGPLLAPGASAYDDRRQVWNGMIDRRPAAIARCSAVADVIAAVRFAHENDLLLSVRGGGHNVAGSAMNDDGLVVDLSAMRGVHVDPAGRTVWAQGGATWGDVDRETQLFGLAAPGGVVSTTGIAGLALSGGVSAQRRRDGMTIDNLVSADVVTADGRFVRASEHENPDLFWALRGGGGNFGVVTGFEFRLHELGPEVMVVHTAYPLERAAEVLRAYREVVAAAPDELTAEFFVWSLPDVPELPEEFRGRAYTGVVAMYAGPADEGERATRGLRELDTPLLDLSMRMPYLEKQSQLDPLFPDGLNYYWKALYLDEIPDPVVDDIVAGALDRRSPQTLVILRHLGGAIERVPVEATAFADRHAQFMLSIDSTWADAADSDENVEYTRRFWSDMRRHSGGRTYFNFASDLLDDEDVVRASYGPNYDRLVDVKTKYDPDNLFRMNQNIAPRR